MRIGELAGLVGVSTRAVRHYHRIGLLPEPARRANGYRDYSLRDAVALARVRRLSELGLSLEEIGDVLADDAGRELPEVLAELDAELARQEAEIRERRVRLAGLLRRAEEGEGLPAEGPVSPELGALFGEMARASAALPGPEPAMAAKERELLALLETAASAETRGWLAGLVGTMGSGEAAMRRAYAIYARMDELAGAAVDDGRIDGVAEAIAAAVPEEVARAAAAADVHWSAEEDGGFAEAYFADFAPAQAEAVRRAMRLLRERAGRTERGR
jgi:DNA-binding transcriptional MerR regulator